MLSALELVAWVPPTPPPRIDPARCVLCGTCVVACPEAAVWFAPDASGAAATVWVDDARCTRCGACEDACPESAVECSYQVVLGQGVPR